MFDAKELEYLEAMEKRLTEQMAAMFTASEERAAANMRVILESSIGPQLQLLAEGQKNLLETLAPKSRVEALEDEIVFMKSVIKALSQDVNELKKAQ